MSGARTSVGSSPEEKAPPSVCWLGRLGPDSLVGLRSIGGRSNASVAFVPAISKVHCHRVCEKSRWICPCIFTAADPAMHKRGRTEHAFGRTSFALDRCEISQRLGVIYGGGYFCFSIFEFGRSIITREGEGLRGGSTSLGTCCWTMMHLNMWWCDQR